MTYLYRLLVTVVSKYAYGKGMPVDNAHGEAKAYLENLSYAHRG